MTITKIADFNTEEIDALKSAGTILGSLVKAMDVGEITEVTEDSMLLIKAVYDVATRAHSKTYRGQ